MRKMKIGMMNPFFYPFQGGTEKVIYEVGKRLAKKGHEVHVFAALHDDKLPAEDIIDGIVVNRAPAHMVWKAPPQLVPPFPIFKDFERSGKKFAKDKDIIQINNRFIFSYPQMVMLASSKKPITLTIHNATPQNIDFFSDTSGALHDKVMLRAAYRYLSGITAVSQAALDMSVPDYKGPKEAIWNGVDSDVFKPKRKICSWNDIPKDKPLVLTNCRLVKQKGLEYLIEAMKGLKARLIIFGRGPLEHQLKELAKKKQVDVIFIKKHISEDELVDLINICDVFVLASLYEPFGLAALEAMSCGKPVIVSDVHGLPEVIGESGFVVEAREVTGLRAAIETAITDEALRKEFGKKARDRAVKNFSWDKISGKYEKFFVRIIEK